MTTFSFRQLQDELKPWTDHNFGPQEPWKPLLGVFEELGELSEANDRWRAAKELKPETVALLDIPLQELRMEVVDAVADTVIYLADFCNTMDLDLTAIVLNHVENVVYDELATIGKLAHAFLKSAQNIRGSSAEHRAKIEKNIGKLVFVLQCFVEDNLGSTLPPLVEPVWERVKKRDFKKDPKDGGETPAVTAASA